MKCLLLVLFYHLVFATDVVRTTSCIRRRAAAVTNVTNITTVPTTPTPTTVARASSSR